MPLPANALHAALVTSSKPHARLLGVDASAALALPGVAGYFDHRSVPGDNRIGAVVHDEEVFATETVTCVGQVRAQQLAAATGCVYCAIAQRNCEVMKRLLRRVESGNGQQPARPDAWGRCGWCSWHPLQWQLPVNNMLTTSAAVAAACQHAAFRCPYRWLELRWLAAIPRDSKPLPQPLKHNLGYGYYNLDIQIGVRLSVQVIGIVVADSQATAQRAARLVAVTYEDLPAVMSCEEAIAAGSFYDYDHKIECGDVDGAFSGGLVSCRWTKSSPVDCLAFT